MRFTIVHGIKCIECLGYISIFLFYITFRLNVFISCYHSFNKYNLVNNSWYENYIVPISVQNNIALHTFFFSHYKTAHLIGLRFIAVAVAVQEGLASSYNNVTHHFISYINVCENVKKITYNRSLSAAKTGRSFDVH